MRRLPPLLTLLAIISLFALGVPSTGVEAATTTFQNTNQITVPINDDFAPNLYPSVITVSGLAGEQVSKITVELKDVTFEDDPAWWSIMLEGPNGETTMLMRRAGGFGGPITTAIDFEFDDDAATPVASPPANGGIYQPTDNSTGDLPAPAPAGPYNELLAASFNGIDPNGDWKLWARGNLVGPEDMVISGGWAITVHTVATAGFANTAPVNQVPGTQSTAEDTNEVFSSGNGNQISIADNALSTEKLQVQLTATSGQVTLPSTTGLTFQTGDGTSDSTMAFSGTNRPSTAGSTDSHSSRQPTSWAPRNSGS